MNTLMVMSTTPTTPTPPQATNPPVPAPPPQAIAQRLHEELLALHGPILGGEQLAHALGYGTLAAFRQARRRNQVDVTLFTLPNRRGVFALTLDVASWLAHARQVNRLVPDTVECPLKLTN